MSSSQEPPRPMPEGFAASGLPTGRPDAGFASEPAPYIGAPTWPTTVGYTDPVPPPGYPQGEPSGYGIVTGPGPLTPGPVNRRRGPGGWLLAAAAVVAAGALTGVLATPVGNLPSLTNPSSKSPTPVASDTPLPKPADVLKKNSIYPLKVTGNCPGQRTPSSWKTFQSQVRALIDCENKAWGSALGSVPMGFSKPHVTFYTKSTDSPCGHLGTSFPASYCSANQTLYFSRASYQQGRYYRLSVAEFVFHEYAHHVQSLAGLFTASASLKEDEEITERRIELQAHCIAHYRLTHAGLKFSSADREDVEYQLGYASDAKGHGSAKAGRRWGEAGLDGKTIDACNTWKAKASLVK